MKAVVYTQYGSPDVLQLKEIAKPEPKENQVLVKVHAASANALDYRRFEKLSSMGRFMEERLIKSIGKALGADIAGVVEAVGASVKQFQPGDEVFGVAAGSSGGFAEYASASENHLALKPANLSFEAAAAVPVAALTALQGLRDKGQIQRGQKVLINGASGGVGTFAVQIAKSFGAEVTAVCSSRNLDMARSIGADHVIDYAKEDFTQGDQRYDLIFAVNGNQPLSAYRRALSPQGSYVCAGGAMSQIFQAILLGSLMSKKNGKKMGFMGLAKTNGKNLMFLGELLESGKIAPVVEKSYPLKEVPAAMSYLAEGHARGKVVVQISSQSGKKQMISRIWYGWTTPQKADKYETLLKEEIFVGIQERHIRGFKGIQLLRREVNHEVEFVTIMTFESLDAVREFVREDYEAAVVPEKARKLLSRFDERSQHYKIRVERSGEI